MAEGARLESVYTLIAYRGFESLSLRQLCIEKPRTAGLFHFCLLMAHTLAHTMAPPCEQTGVSDPRRVLRCSPPPDLEAHKTTPLHMIILQSGFAATRLLASPRWLPLLPPSDELMFSGKYIITISVLVLIVSGSMALVDPQGEPRHMRSIEENG